MSMAARIAIGIVAVLHGYFLVLEMFFWTKPAGLRAFGLTPERAEAFESAGGEPRALQRVSRGGTGGESYPGR